MTITATDEILTVDRIMKDEDGTWCVKCPHCKRILGLESGEIRGEQFKHNRCDGWLEVSHDATVVLP